MFIEKKEKENPDYKSLRACEFHAFMDKNYPEQYFFVLLRRKKYFLKKSTNRKKQYTVKKYTLDIKKRILSEKELKKNFKNFVSLQHLCS